MGEVSGPKLLKRRVMRRKDVSKLKEEAGALLSTDSNSVTQAETDDGLTVYIVEGDVVLFNRGGVLYPTLANQVVENLPSVIVDMGAVPYVCNGADVMSPGIVRVEGVFNGGEIIVIRDENHGKALAIGLALVSSSEIEDMPKGKAIESIHYVGDKLWRTYN